MSDRQQGLGSAADRLARALKTDEELRRDMRIEQAVDQWGRPVLDRVALHAGGAFINRWHSFDLDLQNETFGVDAVTALTAGDIPGDRDQNNIEVPPSIDTGAATSVGFRSFVYGAATTAVGQFARAKGTVATAIGQFAQAVADQATALGQFARASGVRSTAVGQAAQAAGKDSIALGANAHAAGDRAIVIGAGSGETTINAADQAAIVTSRLTLLPHVEHTQPDRRVTLAMVGADDGLHTLVFDASGTLLVDGSPVSGGGSLEVQEGGIPVQSGVKHLNFSDYGFELYANGTDTVNIGLAPSGSGGGGGGGGAGSIMRSNSRSGSASATSVWLSGLGTTFSSGATVIAPADGYDATKRYRVDAYAGMYMTPGSAPMWLAAKLEWKSSDGVGGFQRSAPGTSFEHLVTSQTSAILEPGELATAPNPGDSVEVRLQVRGSNTSQSIRDGFTICVITPEDAAGGGGGTTIARNGASASTSSTGGTPVSDLAITIGANETWHVSALFYGGSYGADGMRVGIDGPSGADLLGSVEGRQPGSGWGGSPLAAVDDLSLVAFAPTSLADVVQITAQVWTGSTGGTVVPRIAAATSGQNAVISHGTITAWQVS